MTAYAIEEDTIYHQSIKRICKIKRQRIKRKHLVAKVLVKKNESEHEWHALAVKVALCIDLLRNKEEKDAMSVAIVKLIS